MRKTSWFLGAMFLFTFFFGNGGLRAEEADINITGEWELRAQSLKGREMTWRVTFSQDGEKLSAVMTGPRGNEFQGEGTVKGNVVTWTITISTQRGEISLFYEGTVEGDTMSGSVRRGEDPSGEWTAIRKKDRPAGVTSVESSSQRAKIQAGEGFFYKSPSFDWK